MPRIASFIRFPGASVLALLAVAVLAAATLPGSAHATAQPRVFGGTPTAVPGWMGFLAIREGNDLGLCDGTAIAPNVLLTAGHCMVDETTNKYVDAGQMRVVFGQQDPRGALVSGQAHLVPVVRYAAPSGYGVFGNGVTQNDIAILELAEPAPATISVVPMNRPSLWSAGKTGLVLGWGLTRDGDQNSAPNQLLRATMPIESDAYCRSTVPNFSTVSMLCVGNGTGPSPCQGDSGGPLLVSDGGSGLYEAGVVNSGTTCQDVGAPNLFARVGGTPLGTWIATTSHELQADANSRGGGPVPSAPVQTAPAPAPTPKPRTATPVPTDVRAELQRALTESMGSRFTRASKLRTSCHEQTTTDYACAAAWYKRPNDYTATVEVFKSTAASSTTSIWDYTGSFKSVNHRCAIGRHRSSCRATRSPLRRVTALRTR